MNLTDEAINTISDWASYIALVGTVISAVAAIVMFWTSGIKEARFESQINTVKIEAQNARNDLIKLKTPRTLTKQQLQNITDAAAPYAGQRFRGLIGSGSIDAGYLWELIANALINAGWVAQEPELYGIGKPGAEPGLSTFEGVFLVTEDDAPSAVNIAAKILTNTLNDNGINTGIDHFEKYIPPNSETDSIAGFRREEPFAIETIHIQVGSKPLD